MYDSYNLCNLYLQLLLSMFLPDNIPKENIIHVANITYNIFLIIILSQRGGNIFFEPRFPFPGFWKAVGPVYHAVKIPLAH